ncbi:MAG: antitoxin family protein [Pirellulales bacterium]|nr:antitoxin family protein [Pirellulales bacterium]
MTQIIQAIYEDGVLKPLDALDLHDHQQVQVTVETTSENVAPEEKSWEDPLRGLRVSLGRLDLSEHMDEYRFGRRP